MASFHLLKDIFYVPLLVFKGIYRYLRGMLLEGNLS